MLLLYPIATDRRPKETPFVTYGIVAINVLVTGWWLLFTGGNREVLRTLGFVPDEPTWYGVFTSMFMHGGLMHLGGNMLFLVPFGRNVEDALGHLLFGCSYVVCGITAMIMHLAVAAAFKPRSLDIPAVGASGAISGLLGLFGVRFYRRRSPCGTSSGYSCISAWGPFRVFSGGDRLLVCLAAPVGCGRAGRRLRQCRLLGVHRRLRLRSRLCVARGHGNRGHSRVRVGRCGAVGPRGSVAERPPARHSCPHRRPPQRRGAEPLPGGADRPVAARGVDPRRRRLSDPPAGVARPEPPSASALSHRDGAGPRRPLLRGGSPP